MTKISKDQRFGKWTAIKTIRETAKSGNRYTKWMVQCDCGNICYVASYDLIHNKTTQCRKCYGSLPKNLLGKVFEEWTVLREGDKKNGKTHWICRCSCGNEENVCYASLTKGVSTRCVKCYQKAMPVHGYTCNKNRHPLYNTWITMIARCENKNSNSYKNYGGRGISVCDRWKKLENFTEDMGEKPFKNASIDRVDNSKGYYKENCRWANNKEQMRNTRKTIFLTYNNETRCLNEWAEFFKIKPNTLYAYLKRNCHAFDEAYKYFSLTKK